MMSLRKVHGWMKGVVALLTRIVGWGVLAILVYLVLAVNATIVLRAGFGISLPWIMDSAQMVMPLLALSAAAVAFARESHPRMEFLLQKFPPKLRHTVNVSIYAITVILMAALSYYSWSYAQLGKAITITSMDFLTLHAFYITMPIGFACITIICLERLLHALAYGQTSTKGKEA